EPCGDCGSRPVLSQSCSALLSAPRGDRQAQLALAHDRVNPGDVLADDPKPPVVLQLPGGHLEAEVEQLLLGLLEPLHELLVVQFPELGCGDASCHQKSPPSRDTILHFIGSLCAARVSASTATLSFGNVSSNMIRPGLTFATQCSGEPLPDP